MTPSELRSYWESRFMEYMTVLGSSSAVLDDALTKLAAVPDESLPAVSAGPVFMYEIVEKASADRYAQRNEAIRRAYADERSNARQAVSRGQVRKHDTRRAQRIEEECKRWGYVPPYIITNYIYRWCHNHKVPAPTRLAMTRLALVECGGTVAVTSLTNAYTTELHKRCIDLLKGVKIK